jgi:enoyl-CoA hydratase/carnithine racemase
MTYENSLVEPRGNAGRIRLNRPARMNARNDALVAGLAAVFGAKRKPQFQGR